MNIVDIIRSETEQFEDKLAVVDADTSLSYGSLLAVIDTLAGTLKEMGVKPTERVGLLCDDSADYVSVSLAILSLSAVIVPIASSLTEAEISDILVRLDVGFLLFDRALRDDPLGLPLAAGSVCVRSFSVRRLDSGNSFPPEYKKMNPAFVRFSSGTTGRSKGVLLSHEAIVERTTAANKALQITHQDTVLWVLSMSFHFVVSILLFLRKGATIVVCRDNFPLSLQEGLTQYGGTFIYASPFHYYTLAVSHGLTPDALSDVRLAISTATSLSSDIAQMFVDKFGLQLSSAYGIIEVGLPFVNDSAAEKQGSVGQVLPDYDVLIDQHDADGTGRILLKGPGMFDAYCSPWQTRTEVVSDGWFDTGDLGRIDAEGFLFILGRGKDVINFAGMKVFPYEVESVINQHPLVKESLVYAVSHPQYGQLPSAKVVLKDGSSEDEILAKLRRHCSERLVSYKIPKQFEFVDKLDKTTSNKLVRR